MGGKTDDGQMSWQMLLDGCRGWVGGCWRHQGGETAGGAVVVAYWKEVKIGSLRWMRGWTEGTLVVSRWQDGRMKGWIDG